jgi:hypothetical protein
MAFKKTQRRSGTGRQTRTTSVPGGRTRVSTTRKLSHGFTQSRSVNKNGTVKVRTTHKTPAGIMSTKQKTYGSAPRKPKAPKFIKAKPFRLPKFRIGKPKVSVAKAGRSGRVRSGSGGSSDGLSFIEFLLLPILIPIWIIKGIFSFTIWLITNPWVWAGLIVLIYFEYF